MAVRPIDANELLGIERLLDTDVVRQSKTASWLLNQVLHDIQAMPTLTLETCQREECATCSLVMDKDKILTALDMALSALRPVSREQVEKVWRGEWERITDPYGKLEGFLCKCGTQTYSASNFCPHCGGAKTDEAVQRVMRRLEALYEV